MTGQHASTPADPDRELRALLTRPHPHVSPLDPVPNGPPFCPTTTDTTSTDPTPRLQALAASLGQMLGHDDHETLDHTERVATLAARMAEHLGLPAARRDALVWGARMHDIGKLAVPGDVLAKRGPLTPDEWRAMRGHVEAGLAIAESLGCLPRTALLVLAQHHERWDGRGYPARLHGEQICLEARIFTLCDVWDALTQARPYKAAWTAPQAGAELERLAGQAFDPALVPAFLAVVTADT